MNITKTMLASVIYVARPMAYVQVFDLISDINGFLFLFLILMKWSELVVISSSVKLSYDGDNARLSVPHLTWGWFGANNPN